MADKLSPTASAAPSIALPVSEATFVTGLSVRAINHEIDEGIVRADSAAGIRRIGLGDLLYLRAVKGTRNQMARALRGRLREAILAASAANADQATLAPFTLALDVIRDELAAALSTLDAVKRDHVESRPDILAGEPVLRGTRIPARHIADLLKTGATCAEIEADFDLVPEQIEAARIFDRVTPRRGRPARTRLPTAPADVSAA